MSCDTNYFVTALAVILSVPIGLFGAWFFFLRSRFPRDRKKGRK